MANKRAVIHKLIIFISLWLGSCAGVYASPLTSQASHVAQADANDALTASEELPDPSPYLTKDEVAKNPDRYAEAMRVRIAREEKVLNVLSESVYKHQYKQQLRDDYLVFAPYLRFTLHKPDEAIAVYQNMAKLEVDSPPVFDLATLAIADIQRFDKHDSKKAVEIYQKEFARSSAGLSDADKEHSAMVHRWIKFELDYLEHGKQFSGSIDRKDVDFGNLVILFFQLFPQKTNLPLNNVRNVVEEAKSLGRNASYTDVYPSLGSLPASQLNLAGILVGAYKSPPQEIVRFFAKHDPAGYLTAVILAVSTGQSGSAGKVQGVPELDIVPQENKAAVVSAADIFFKAHSGRLELESIFSSRYSSPESTWALFIKSARNGDRATMISCLTNPIKDKVQKPFENMTNEQLRNMADGLTGFSVISRYEDIAEATIARVVGDKQMGSIVEFVKVGGEWKIEGM